MKTKTIGILAVPVLAISMAFFGVVSTAHAASYPTECRYQVDSGPRTLDELPSVLPMQASIFIECSLQLDGSVSKLTTELLDPRWRVTDKGGTAPPILGPVLNLGDYEGQVIVELWGRLPSLTTSQEVPEAPGYHMETAPPRRVRILAMTDRTGVTPISESLIVHAAHFVAVNKLNKIQLHAAGIPSASTFIMRTESLIQEGQPWSAAALADEVDPLLLNIRMWRIIAIASLIVLAVLVAGYVAILWRWRLTRHKDIEQQPVPEVASVPKNERGLAAALDELEHRR